MPAQGRGERLGLRELRVGLAWVGRLRFRLGHARRRPDKLSPETGRAELSSRNQPHSIAKGSRRREAGRPIAQRVATLYSKSDALKKKRSSCSAVSGASEP